ncbi:MAG TPA: lysophospholipid acyltransferase family protein [Myxococcota bacterium]|jgi:1-acyl-sn-glycerol-3-phosphate acyltransferase|nr:lysophospholipid acyltransferase family protein [Myxococcota bacterium]
MIGTLRVSLRLCLLAALTGVTVMRLRVARALRGPRPHSDTRLGRAWARRMLRLLGVELEVHGQPPAETALLLANHRSYVDIAALLAQIPCAFLAKHEISEWPLFGTAARYQHTVFVKRECKESRRASRGAAVQVLRQGLCFAAFPEGTTTRGPGTLPFFRGLFEVAQEHAVPVVPVAIEYGDRADAWVDDETFLGHFLGCFRKRRIRVAIAFGPVLRPEAPDALRARTESWIRERLETLAPSCGERSAPARLEPPFAATAPRIPSGAFGS